MKILILGDVVGSIGCNFLKSVLSQYKKDNNIDIVIANGENSADGNGITQKSANIIFDSGIDVITTGNHIFKQPDYKDLLKNNKKIIRPANLYKDIPGSGYYILKYNNIKVCVINLLGLVYMPGHNYSPFDMIDKILEKVKAEIIIVDFHAEATSEKLCLGYYLDSRVTAVVGTHTHVQTADEQIFPGNTAYISDLGMVGPTNSVLGVDKNIAILKMRTGTPVKFQNATGKCKMCGVTITIDDISFKPINIQRVYV